MRICLCLLLSFSALTAYADRQRQLSLALALATTAEGSGLIVASPIAATEPVLPQPPRMQPVVYGTECVSGSCYRVYRQPQRVWRRRY